MKHKLLLFSLLSIVILSGQNNTHYFRHLVYSNHSSMLPLSISRALFRQKDELQFIFAYQQSNFHLIPYEQGKLDQYEFGCYESHWNSKKTKKIIYQKQSDIRIHLHYGKSALLRCKKIYFQDVLVEAVHYYYEHHRLYKVKSSVHGVRYFFQPNTFIKRIMRSLLRVFE